MSYTDPTGYSWKLWDDFWGWLNGNDPDGDGVYTGGVNDSFSEWCHENNVSVSANFSTSIDMPYGNSDVSTTKYASVSVPDVEVPELKFDNNQIYSYDTNLSLPISISNTSSLSGGIAGISSYSSNSLIGASGVGLNYGNNINEATNNANKSRSNSSLEISPITDLIGTANNYIGGAATGMKHVPNTFNLGNSIGNYTKYVGMGLNIISVGVGLSKDIGHTGYYNTGLAVSQVAFSYAFGKLGGNVGAAAGYAISSESGGWAAIPFAAYGSDLGSKAGTSLGGWLYVKTYNYLDEKYNIGWYKK